MWLPVWLIVLVGGIYYTVKVEKALWLKRRVETERMSVDVIKPDCGRYSPSDNDNHVWPWHVMIYKSSNDGHETNWDRICGGTVISEKYIITHIQCISKAKENWKHYRLVVGKFDDDWKTMGEHEQRLTIKNVSSNHVENSWEALVAISLVKVDENSTIKFGYYVRPVCMSLDVQLEFSKLVPNALGIVPVYIPPFRGPVGFGVQKNALISHHTCKYIYGKKRGWSQLPADTFCGRSTNSIQENVVKLCNNDIGSGVAFAENYNNEIRYFFRGVFTDTVHTNPCDESFIFLHLTSYPIKELLLIENQWYL